MITTNYNNSYSQNLDHTYHKLKIGLALNEYFKDSNISDYPALYIGSDVDLEFPLILQAKKIVMLDPCFSGQQKINEVVHKANTHSQGDLKIKHVSPWHTHLGFVFDFGQGREKVTVDMISQKYEDFESILPLGYIIEFNGILAHTLHKPNIIKKLMLGGIIINNQESPLRQKSLTITDILQYGQNKDELESKKAQALGLNTIRIPDVPFAVYQKFREEEQLINYSYRSSFKK
ncbi:MAG: hypothetical protein WC570_02770 [Patescibacteria group bacterium]